MIKIPVIFLIKEQVGKKRQSKLNIVHNLVISGKVIFSSLSDIKKRRKNKSVILFHTKGALSCIKLFSVTGWLNYSTVEVKVELTHTRIRLFLPWCPTPDWQTILKSALPLTGFEGGPSFSSLIHLVSNCYLGNEAWALPGLANSWYNCIMEPLHCTTDWDRMRAFCMPASSQLKEQWCWNAERGFVAPASCRIYRHQVVSVYYREEPFVYGSTIK